MEKSGAFTILDKLASILLGGQEETLEERLTTSLILPVTRPSEVKPPQLGYS
jgi:hypothetical protein